MARISIPVMALEFDDDGHTIWVQGRGGTVARIKTLGKFKTDACSPGAFCSHLDIIVPEDIKICLADDVEREAGELDGE